MALKLPALFVIALLLIGCSDQYAKMSRQCQSKGGELVRIRGAKASHLECVKRIQLDR